MIRRRVVPLPLSETIWERAEMAIWTDGVQTWCEGALEHMGAHGMNLWRINANTYQAPSGFAASFAGHLVMVAQRKQRAGQHDVAERALRLAQDYLNDNPDVGMQMDRAEIDRVLALYTGRNGPIRPPGK